MPKENNGPAFEGLNPTLFREFATECMELARSTRSPDRRTLFVKMATMWHQLAQRLEEKVSGKRRSAKLLTRDEARIAADVVKLPRLLDRKD